MEKTLNQKIHEVPLDIKQAIYDRGYQEGSKKTAEKIWNRANHDFIGLDEISLKVLKSIIKHDIGVEIEEN